MSQFNPSKRANVGTQTEQQVVTDFLNKEPEKPNERYSKNEMYQQIEKLYNTLCVLRKVWIESIGTIATEDNEQKYELDYKRFTYLHKDYSTLVREMNRFIEKECGIANVVNISHEDGCAVLWHARSV